MSFDPVGVIGVGAVGQAVATLLHNAGIHTFLNDPRLGEQSTSLSKMVAANPVAIYICVNSPPRGDGTCDSSALESVVAELVKLKYHGLVIAKTTAPPAVYARLQSQCPALVHAPEFMRQATSYSDLVRPPYLLYGGDRKYTEKVSMLEQVFINRNVYTFREVAPAGNSTVPAHHTSIETAALYKYLRNAFLAAKVTFLNDFFTLAEAVGANWGDIEQVLATDPKVGDGHNSVPGPDGLFGWAGACFPKDLTALLSYANINAVDLPVLEAVAKRNQQHRLKNKDTK